MHLTIYHNQGSPCCHKPPVNYPIYDKPHIIHDSIHANPYDGVHPTPLFKEAYLGEFRTRLDKAKARANLGIPDSFDLIWGKIEGDLRNLADLYQQFLDINTKILLITDKLGNINNDNVEELKIQLSILNEVYGKMQINLDTLTSNFNKQLLICNNFLNTTTNVINNLLTEVNKLKESDANKTVQIKVLEDNLHNPYDDTEIRLDIENLKAILHLPYDDTELRNLIATLFDKIAGLEVEKPQTVSYVGYADDFNKIMGNESFATTNIYKEWNSANTIMIEAPIMSFWVITTLPILQILNGPFSIQIPEPIEINYKESPYKVYQVSIVTNNKATYTIK